MYIHDLKISFMHWREEVTSQFSVGVDLHITNYLIYEYSHEWSWHYVIVIVLDLSWV